MDNIVSIVAPYWHLAVVGTALLILSIDFLRRFVIPGRHLSKELEASISSLTSIRARTNGDFVELDEIAICPCSDAG